MLRNMCVDNSSYRCLIMLLSVTLFACGSASGYSAPCQDVASLNITELFPDPLGSDTNQEWLEIYNPHDKPAQLVGLVLEIQGAGRPRKIRLFDKNIPAPQTVEVLEPKHYAWIHNQQDTNAASSQSRGIFTKPWLKLPNQQGSVRLLCEQRVLAEVRYGEGHLIPQTGKSLQFDGQRWCLSPKPTPSQANPGCHTFTLKTK